MNSSLTETRRVIEMHVIPSWARERGLTRCFVYSGSSMTPTFRSGHLLYVRPAACDIGPGDVVVFAGPSRNGYVVHRVVSATDAGLVTRGDNNRLTDIMPVAADRLVGRVEMVDALGRLKPVHGRSRGLWSARMRWGARRVSCWLCRVFREPYRMLRRSPIVHRMFSHWLSPHLAVVRIETPAGPLFKTTYRGRVVARWWPQRNRFECRKPFDLVIPRPEGAGMPDPR